MSKLAVSQTPVKDYQLTLVQKTSKEYNNNKKNFQLVDFAFPDNHGVKIGESRMMTKYLNLGKELKNLLYQLWLTRLERSSKRED